MQREPIFRQRIRLAVRRPPTGGERPSRLLDDYRGAPHHGRTRTNVDRDRPRREDLLENEEF